MFELRIFEDTKIDYIWRKIYREKMFGKVNLGCFIRINRLKWISYVNRMDKDRMPESIFNNQSERNRLRGRSRNRWHCVKSDLKKCKIVDWKRFIEEAKALTGL